MKSSHTRGLEQVNQTMLGSVVITVIINASRIGVGDHCDVVGLQCTVSLISNDRAERIVGLPEKDEWCLKSIQFQ